MWLVLFACLLVSIDALFIGVCLGAEKRCRFWHLCLINVLLFALCMVGWGIGLALSSFDVCFDLIIGYLFIGFGFWIMISHASTRNILTVGILMSIEAMLITVGLMLTLETTTVVVPIVIALAHFVYSAVMFFLAKYFRRLPSWVGCVVSGVALISYGIMALVL